MKKHIFKLRVLLVFGVINLLFISQSKLFAQGDFGCGDDDPTEECPLDTWVFVLITLVIIIGMYNWWKKQSELKLELKT